MSVSLPGRALPVRVADCNVHCRVLGEPRRGALNVLLLHGLASHSGWWQRVAERIAPAYFVACLEFSGHGRSGRRTRYSGPKWAAEARAAMELLAADGHWLVAGHSMGGAIATRLSGLSGLAGLALLDTQLSPIRGIPDFKYPERHWQYASLTQLVTNFRVWPPETMPPAELRRLALQAAVEVRGRFEWHFDPGIFAATDRALRVADLRGVEPPVAVLRGALSPVLSPLDVRAIGTDRLAATIVEVAEARHHVVVTHPDEVARFLLRFAASLLPSGVRATGRS